MTSISTTTPAPITDRKAASKLNPLIDSAARRGTLSNCANVITDLGYFLSDTEHSREKDSERRFGNLFQLFQPIVAALEFERDAA
jgi:hypothetical protein